MNPAYANQNPSGPPFGGPYGGPPQQGMQGPPRPPQPGQGQPNMINGPSNAQRPPLPGNYNLYIFFAQPFLFNPLADVKLNFNQKYMP